MDKGSPPRVKEPFPSKLKRFQVRTLRVWHMEGVSLISKRDLNKDNGANQLHTQEAEHLLPLVVPPLLPWSSWVAFTPGTLQTLGERGGKRMLIRLTCSTSLSPSMSPLRKLRPSPLQYLGTWSEADAGGIL